MNHAAPFTVAHFPHASLVIPEDVCQSLLVDQPTLEHELLQMTDRYVDELYCLPESFGRCVKIELQAGLGDDATERLALLPGAVAFSFACDNGG